jgi:hypothetical protein
MKMDSEYDGDHTLLYSTFQSSFGIWEDMYLQLEIEPARSGEVSPSAALLFADALILEPSEHKAREQMTSDRKGALSFYEIAHDIRDLLLEQQEGRGESDWRFVYSSDGRHEPFLLVASAVLNRLEWINEQDR